MSTIDKVFEMGEYLHRKHGAARHVGEKGAEWKFNINEIEFFVSHIEDIVKVYAKHPQYIFSSTSNIEIFNEGFNIAWVEERITWNVNFIQGGIQRNPSRKTGKEVEEQINQELISAGTIIDNGYTNPGERQYYLWEIEIKNCHVKVKEEDGRVFINIAKGDFQYDQAYDLFAFAEESILPIIEGGIKSIDRRIAREALRA